MVLAVTTAACVDESVDAVETPVTYYVGSVTAAEGTSSDLPNVVVGMAMKDGVAELFFCGGPEVVNTRTAWFSGEVDSAEAGASDADVSLHTPGWEVSGRVSDASASGTVELFEDGVTMTWEMARVIDGVAGLYVAPAAGCRTGVVVHDPEDGEAWAQGAYCDPRGFFDQVTPVMPISLTAELALSALVGNPRREILLERLVPTLEPAAQD